MDKKKLTPITCDYCGKRIRKGSTIYRERGLTYMCCSAACLLYAMTTAYTEESTGYYETQEEDEE